MSLSTVLLGPQCQVVCINGAARRMLANNSDSLRVTEGRFETPAAPGVVMRGIDRLQGTMAAGAPSLALALQRTGRLPLTMMLSRVPPSGGRVWMLTLCDPHALQPDPERLRELFDLTQSEARIAAGLADGRSTAGLAQQLGVQSNTVRAHLKQVLAKTGTTRQGELVALLLRCVAMGAPAPPFVAARRHACGELSATPAIDGVRALPSAAMATRHRPTTRHRTLPRTPHQPTKDDIP